MGSSPVRGDSPVYAPTSPCRFGDGTLVPTSDFVRPSGPYRATSPVFSPTSPATSPAPPSDRNNSYVAATPADCATPVIDPTSPASSLAPQSDRSNSYRLTSSANSPNSPSASRGSLMPTMAEEGPIGIEHRPVSRAAAESASPVSENEDQPDIQIEHVQQQMAVLARSLEATAPRLAQERERADRATVRLCEVEAHLAAVKTQLDGLTEDFTHSEARRVAVDDRLHNNVTMNEGIVARANARVLAANERRRNAEAELITLREDAVRDNAQIGLLRNERTGYRRQVQADITQIFEEHRDELHQLQDDLLLARDNNDRHRDDVREAKQRIEVLRTRLDHAGKAVDRLEKCRGLCGTCKSQARKRKRDDEE
ncbi:unnamed protein product [Zymoseptoria tritici ST99CH_1E4]|uniref:SWI5-dependent HO expression protein 3 n=1 Tax=Zymoseptoria tritici ST99CH_1E4 TaxID=1276532 RepID=A0A2H1H9R5_ZYMTR|nr:unnamed protein product [Zymoseptoria tritici ST99CH_1E4]